MDFARVFWSGDNIAIGDENRICYRNKKTLAEQYIVDTADKGGLGCVQITGSKKVGVWNEKGALTIYEGEKQIETIPMEEGLTMMEVRLVGRRSVTGIQNRGGQSVRVGDTVIIYAKAHRSNSVIKMLILRTKQIIQLAEVESAATHMSVSSPEPNTIAFATPQTASVHVIDLTTTVPTVQLPSTFRTTSLAVHPFSSIVSIGDSTGRIRTWSISHEHTMKEAHWHAHSVSVLQYNSDGTTLISGGEESVLLLWNTRSWTSNKIARLPGPILTAQWFPDDADVVVGCAPGTLLIINVAERKPSCVVHGENLLLGQPCTGIKPMYVPTGVVLALEGMDNMVRVFDPSKRQYLRTIKVAPSNVTSKVNNTPLPKITVKHLVASRSGQHLVTLEQSDVSLNGVYMSTMRFWNLSGDGLEWKVNTFIDNPHEENIVTSLAMHRTRNIVVSTSKDGTQKQWKFTAGHWTHSATLKLNCDEALCNELSDDGTVLAVGTDSCVSCVTCPGFQDLGVLTQHLTGSSIQQVVFPAFAERQAVVAHCNTHLFGWDLASRGLIFSIEIRIFTLSPCDAGYLAVTESTIMRFDSSTPTPCCALDLPSQPTALLCLPTLVAFVDQAGTLKYLSAAESGRLFPSMEADGVGEIVEVVEEKASGVSSLFSLSAGQVRGSGEGRINGGAKPCFTDPLLSCKSLSAFYEGATHSLQAPSVSLNPLLDSLFTYE
eukprot:TRINITY_DN12689_c0_g1_i1.p1 TRINITY_DN12689_c0_g1~~TRINITY_DN12689_c0_g1_i1.p1  ORF type:complete len:736 (+),score=87.34 TRINITY_DN12689_c0_g1_i1:61-2208(+)